MKFSLIIFALSLVTGPVFAQSYRERAKELEKRISFDLPFNTPEMERAEIITDLYNLVFKSANTKAFAKDGLIRRIHVVDTSGYGAKPDAFYLALRENTLLYPQQQKLNVEIEKMLPAEIARAKEIQTLQSKIQALLPSVNFSREPDYTKNYTATNESYQRILHIFADGIQAPGRLAKLKRMNSILLTDFTSYGDETRAEISQSNGKASLRIFTSRENPEEDVTLTPEVLARLFTISVDKGFSVADATSLLATSAEYHQGLIALEQFLTPTMITKLKKNEVYKIVLDREYETHDKLFESHVLTVGITTADMQKVVDLLF